MRLRLSLSVLILIAITAWRVWLVDSLDDQGFFAKYLIMGERIAAGELARERLGDFSPLYLWLVTLFHGVGRLEPATLRIAQIVMVSLAALFAGATAYRFGGFLAAALSSLFVLGSRAALVNATEIEPETLILLLNVLSMFFLMRPMPNDRMKRLSGLALGLSTITRPSAALLTGLLAAWLWIRDKTPPRAFGIGFLIPVVPILVLNLLLTGNLTIMDPGTVLYEGMNPYATGYAGVQPRIVNDLEATSREPDALHLAYRFVASRASGRNLSRGESNRYWIGKALAFAFYAPADAMKLVGKKILFALKSHEAYDLSTMFRKDQQLRRKSFWIPFSLLLTLALTGSWLIRDANVVVPLSLYGVTVFLTLVLFYVTARQRNAIVPVLAILAGLAIARLVAEARQGAFAGVIGSLLLVTVLTVALHRNGDAQREDLYGWIAASESQRLLHEAANEPSRAERLRAIASTWTTTDEAETARAPLREVALAGLQRTRSPQRRFDLGLALARSGDWSEAEKVFSELQRASYRPVRENRTTNSVAFHRARALRRLGQPLKFDAQLRIAVDEQPGDANVLAARALDGDIDAADALDRLYDPFTRDLALARASLDRGNRAEAENLARNLLQKMREWPRARKFATLIGSLSTSQP